MYDPKSIESRLAMAVSLLVIFIVAVLLFSLPARAGNVAQIFICAKEAKECNQETARIIFTIHVENPMPAMCLREVETSLAKTWHDIADKDEIPKIRCGG